MNKTKATRNLEYHVYDYLYLTRSLSCAMEVNIPLVGRADIVGVKNKEITIVEIKVTKQDFRSDYGKNFYGHKNYYAMPNELFEEIKEEIPKHIGVMAYVDGRVKVVKNARTVKHIYPKRFWDLLKKNIDTAKQSNIRRLLYHRYTKENK